MTNSDARLTKRALRSLATTWVIRDRLYQARLRAGLTQAAVSRALDVSRHGYHYIERGKRPLYVDHFLVLCDLFDLDPAQVLTVTDDDLLTASPTPRVERCTRVADAHR